MSEGVPAGVPLEVVSDLAGHKDVETTDRVNRARRDDVQRAASEALSRHLAKLTNGGPRTASPYPEQPMSVADE